MRSASMRSRMRLLVTPLGAFRGFALAGELDMSTARELASSIDSELRLGGDIVLDLSALTFMDSTGLQVLIRCALELERRGRLVLRAPNRLVRSILELAIHTDKLPNLLVEDESFPRPV